MSGSGGVDTYADKNLVEGEICLRRRPLIRQRGENVGKGHSQLTLLMRLRFEKATYLAWY